MLFIQSKFYGIPRDYIKETTKKSLLASELEGHYKHGLNWLDRRRQKEKDEQCLPLLWNMDMSQQLYGNMRKLIKHMAYEYFSDYFQMKLELKF